MHHLILSIAPIDEVGPTSSSGPSSSTSDDSSTYYLVHCFCWQDRKHVNLVNSITHPREVTAVVRKQKDGTTKRYPSPLAAELYNKYMGGVDMADFMCRLYSCSQKSKHKWYMCGCFGFGWIHVS